MGKVIKIGLSSIVVGVKVVPGAPGENFPCANVAMPSSSLG
jgi:hypothetical protein